MNSVSIEDIDLNNSFFHFTARDNLESIEEKGLIAQIGDASRMVNDKPRVCLSKGGKGILGIKNSFIHMFRELRICDIPDEYRKYFSISDFSSTEQVSAELVYDAMEKRFKDEVYLKVDAQEGEDFSLDEVHGIGSAFDIKGKENHDIDSDKLSKVNAPEGDNALDIVQYIYRRLLERNPGKEDIIRSMNSDLTGMIDYISEREKNQEKSISMKDMVKKAIEDGVNIEDIAYVDRDIDNQKEVEEVSKDE